MHPTDSALQHQLEATERILDHPTLSATTRAYLEEQARKYRSKLNGKA